MDKPRNKKPGTANTDASNTRFSNHTWLRTDAGSDRFLCPPRYKVYMPGMTRLCGLWQPAPPIGNVS